MGRLADIKINHAGIQSLLDGGQGVDSMLDSKAAGVAARAQSGAPVDSGAYRDSIHIETDHTDRMVKRVVADVSYSLVVEAKTGNLARALDAAGGS